MGGCTLFEVLYIRQSFRGFYMVRQHPFFQKLNDVCLTSNCVHPPFEIQNLIQKCEATIIVKNCYKKL